MTTLLILTLILVLLPTETYAFGAGDIPDFAFLNGSSFFFLSIALPSGSCMMYLRQGIPPW